MTQPETKFITEKKTSFDDIYNQETSAPYYSTLQPLGYNVYHDTLCDIFQLEENREVAENSQSVFELGALYGNASRAFSNHTKWARLQEDYTMNHEFYASDIAEKALQYGYDHGMFKEIYPYDMNKGINSTIEAYLQKSDVFLASMVMAYFKDNIFEELLNKHAQHGQYALYNSVPMFDDRDYNPERILHSPCEYRKYIIPHRKLTEEEQANSYGVKESYAIMYIVKYLK